MKAARKRTGGEAGYILLSVMLLVAFMLIALSIELPRISQQIKRDKEEELVHRGKEYAMAIRRFVHKTGRYPASLEQLEDTNHIRFLRKRFKDPMTIEGEWRLVHQGEAQINFSPPAGANPGLPGSSTPGLAGGSGPSGNQPSVSQPNPNQQGDQSGNTTQLGSLAIQNIGNGQQIGGGPIIGVASMSKATGIKEFNDQTTYDGWLFVYDPRFEQSGGTGIVVAAPRGTASPGGNTSGSQAPVSPPPGPTPTPPAPQ